MVSDTCGLNLPLFSRFKQIKEQEEARRRQKEEEKRKAEEAAAKGTQPINEGHERDTGAGAGSVAENNEKAQSVSTFHNPSSVGVVVNGDLSGQDSQEDQKTASMFRMENDKVSTNSKVDWSDGQQSYENVEKVL
jgi:YidC/Oxa1 family membrane protein insertase